MMLPGLVSKQYCANVIHSRNHPADIHQAGNFLQTEYEATLRSSFTTYFRPLFEGDTFYTKGEILKALQSGVVSAGTSFQATPAGIGAGITPYHFLPTILGNTFRLPMDGIICNKMVQLIKNMGWWLHVVFHFPSRFRHLQQLNDELSPFMVSAPLAGQLHWLIEHLSKSQSQQAWDRMPARHRVAATNAVMVSLSSLIQIFLDWAVTHTMEQHCLPVFLWEEPSRSDLCVFETTIRVRDYATLQTVLHDWRKECTSSFNATVFTAHTLPINAFYSRAILPDIQPARPLQQPANPPTRPDRVGALGNPHQNPSQQQQPSQQPQRQLQPNVAPVERITAVTFTVSTSAPTRDTATTAQTVHTEQVITAPTSSLLRKLLPPFPDQTAPQQRTLRRQPPHSKALWPTPENYNQYFATVVAPVWPYLDTEDSQALQAANPQNNHPLYGSASMLQLDDLVWSRRRRGWGKETENLQTEHDCPSIFHIVHIVWDYLRVSLRRLMAVTLRDTTHEYATLRLRAATTPVHHLRLERHYPALDLTPICPTRVLDMGAALLRCDFNYGDLLRWLGGEYTQQNQDRSLLRDVITAVRSKGIPSAYPPIAFDEALQAVDEGVPGISKFRCPIRDVARREKENNRGLEHCWDEVMEKYRKEEKLSYHIMFPRFLWKYIPGLFLALISYIPPKPGRVGDEGRLINDPSTPLYPGDRGNVNSQIPKLKTVDHDERQNPKVYYGSVIHRLVKLIYNLRLDHPEEELYIAADDISAAFRWLHYHPDIAVAFATVLDTWLVIPVGMIFGGRFSPGWYMILGELRGHIAATLDIGSATTDLSDNIHLSPAITPQEQATIVAAVRYCYNTGTSAILGPDYKYGFSSFVDDQGVVATRANIREAIHRSVIAA
ncbi:hypothetical protein MPSEU_000709100 [Mayamaea pseudoterrestris]|nr:hypothetical protein MPSEU_000709100 [Mayamaea pseudoterrestris]